MAVGASAGGLEALSSLLSGIPEDAPLALVIVQHLARDQRSLLPELLARATKLKVLAAQDKALIQVRHVYVIPPDARMTIATGHLHVRQEPALREREGTVDALFRSVAEQYREHSVGVVLSGSANDGAAGLREIKAAGGFTIAQEPGQAAVDGMPRAAIATGMVDTVLPVEQIAQHLVRLCRHPFFLRDATAVPEAVSDEDRDLRLAFQLLRRATGIDFNNYKMATLRRRIERRMAVHGMSSLGEYLERLQRDHTELLRLHEELLIHVTSFFREPASYMGLADSGLPRILADHDDDTPIRFWVPGCSTGEEAYSLAMVLLEHLGDRASERQVQIFGTDVSEPAIEKARAGVYGADIAADVSPERLRRFFSRLDAGFRINQAVRDRCVFARQDVTRDPPFSRLDLIVCRNLLIYLNQVTQRKVLNVFHYALRPSGLLMLGRSETIGTQIDLFSVVDKKLQLFGKKPAGGRSELGPHDLPAPQMPPRAVAARPVARAAQWDPQNEANRFLLDAYAPPSVIVDSNLRMVRSRGAVGAFLEVQPGEFSGDIFRMVRPDLLPPLRTALHEARTRRRPAAKEGVKLAIEGQARTFAIRAVPLGDDDGGQILILFEESARSRRVPPVIAKRAVGHGKKSDLERELAATRQQLQSIIDDLGTSNEELQSANEEVLSSNEELQSTNEELDTAKEEMQSTNEELSTLNDELHARNEELTILNSDLVNLLASVQIPIVMVTRDLRIRRFTPAAERALNIITSDVGRPIGHLKPNFFCPDLESIINEVIDTVSIRERRVEGTDGRVFAMQIRPYKTVDNRIDGAIVAMFDISVTENQAEQLKLAEATGESLISTISQPVVLLDAGLRVLKTNRSFTDKFQVAADDTESRFIYDVGNGQWNSPDLRRLLEEVLPEKKNFEGFEVTHDFPTIGRKTMRLDARRIETGHRKHGVIVLVIRDVTNHEP